MTVHWDKDKELLEQEKQYFENPKALGSNDHCCGNQIKSHKKFCLYGEDA